jgi:hypothetical protein
LSKGKLRTTKLSKHQFKSIANTSIEFDNYLKETLGTTASGNARFKQLRTDGYYDDDSTSGYRKSPRGKNPQAKRRTTFANKMSDSSDDSHESHEEESKSEESEEDKKWNSENEKAKKSRDAKKKKKSPMTSDDSSDEDKATKKKRRRSRERT